MWISRTIGKRILRNAGIAVGLNVIIITLACCFGRNPFSIRFFLSGQIKEYLSVLFSLPCLFNIVALSATGGILAMKEKKRAIANGSWQEPPSRKDVLQRIICGHGLGECAEDYIKLVAEKMRYRFEVVLEVAQELTDNFTDALADCDTEEDRQETTQKMLEGFGDAKVLAKLIRRGKKRCRPLWQKLLCSFRTAGIIFLLLLLYTVWFVTGKPVIETDYLAVLNQQHRDIKVGLSDDNNAIYDYEKAEKLFVKPPREIKGLITKKRMTLDEKLTDPEKTLITQWLKANEPTWEQLVVGGKKTHYHFDLEYDNSNTDRYLNELAIPIPLFWRHLRDIGFWRMKMALDQSQTQEAIEDCLAMIRVAPQFAVNSNRLIEHMMASLTTRETLDNILYIVSTNEFSAVELKTLQEQLTRLFPEGYPDLGLCMEVRRTVALDSLQHVFTSSGPGGGHLVPRTLVDDSFFEKRSKTGKAVLSAALSMIHAGRDETVAMTNQFWDIAIEESRMTPYQGHTRGYSISGKFTMDLPEYKHFLLRVAVPIMRGRIEDVFQMKAYYEAAITILALERWNLDKGKYPDSLNELVEDKYITAIAMDPYSDGPLVYKRIDDGFTLYSVGPDFQDNSGQRRKDSNSNVLWTNEWNIKDVDAVFWPVWKGEN